MDQRTCGGTILVTNTTPRTAVAPIIVAVDGTPSGEDAVAWAIEEAGRRDAPMWVLPKRSPERLLAEAGDASLIVVGSAGFLAMTDLAGGSPAMAVAAAADVPVIVVRPGLPDAAPGPSAGRIVVGVDGTGLSRAAADFAVAESHDRCGITIVHALQGERERTAAALAALCSRHPDVRIVVTTGMASRALIEESAGAHLVVVGSRGRAGLGGMLLGSVSQAVVHRAHCPVAVVRSHRGRRARRGPVLPGP
jgi:nucleotide-binding universal stress UspA family protein